ncbi:unnamed protein product [Ambrosiozyma monospora]|uniref:DNA primase large subunit n=1 Tax=Ambrosiozyma monospora TaxID=43982 RepID=A0A9W6YRU0_AMBMO|nr:unnamed protein product [Ambrosiozyma monospora]
MFRKVKRKTDGRRNFDDRDTSFDTSFGAGGFHDDLAQYPHRLSFYKLPPMEEVTLEEFETWAIDRLKVLLEIESCSARSMTFKETEQVMEKLLAKYLPLNVPSKESSSLYQERKKDHYSHFILRLAFCRSEELRRRFVKAETTLFKLRYNMLSMTEQRNFVNSLDLPWVAATDEEISKFESQLYACSYASVRSLLRAGSASGIKITDDQVRQYLKHQTFYKLPFEYVPDLLAMRTAFLHQGYVYVGQFQQSSLILSEFSKFLKEQLDLTVRGLPGLDEDDRLVPVLNNLSKGYISAEYNDGGNFGNGEESEVNSENVNSFLSDMPLCMQRLMEGVSVNHHLKYGGRQQLAFFLKGIGLSADEAIKFWRNQFTKSMSAERFNKDYKYNFRHNYGLEGGRINYKPWDCKTIMNKPNPTKTEYHGCPYRDLHRDELLVMLGKLGLENNRSADDVLDLSNRGEYQAACTKVFELVNRDDIDYALKTKNGNVDQSSIVHPNQYFDRSRYLKKLRAGTVGKGAESQSGESQSIATQ